MNKPTKHPVIFRKDTRPNHQIYDEPEVVAVFPTELDQVGDMSCYVHVGQHGTCSLSWYNVTKAATPEEYAPLLKELQGIYGVSHGEGDEVYELVVYKRRQRRYAK